MKVQLDFEPVYNAVTFLIRLSRKKLSSAVSGRFEGMAVRQGEMIRSNFSSM